MIGSLRARFVLLVLLGGLAPLALVGVWVVRRAPASGEAALRARLSETMRDIAGMTGRNWLRIRTGLLDLVDERFSGAGLGPAFAGENRAQDVQAALARHGLTETVEHLAVIAPDGSTHDLLPSGPASSPRVSTVPVRIPIYGRRGEPLGTLAARVRAAAVLPSDLVLGGVGGSVLAAQDAGGSPILSQPIDPALLERPRFEWRGEPWVAVSQTMEEPPLHLVLAGPAGAFIAPFRRAAREGTLALGAGALLALFLVWVGSGRVTRGLGSLTGASERVAAGDLDVRISETGPAELRRLAGAFNTMSASLRHTLERSTQRETLAALGEYAASLAHEVRNPITSMRLDLERAADRLENTEASRDLVLRAIDELDRLDASVSGALTLARGGTLHLVETDLRDPVRAALHAAEPRFRRCGADLRVDAWPEDPVLFRADPAAIQQLLLNLLLNAADAVERGGTAIVGIDDLPDAIRIEVRDDGEGIAPERLGRVFEPLFSTRPEGTGLGLPMARRIARAHGGSLELESRVGSGTVVTLTLPRTAASPARASASASERAGRSGP